MCRILAGMFLVVAVFSEVSLCAEAEKKKEPTTGHLAQNQKFLDTFAEMYVRMLARQYRLSPEQTEKAKQIYSAADWRLQYKAGEQMEAFGQKMHKALVEKREPSVADVRQMIDKLSPLLHRSMDQRMSSAMQFHAILNEDQKKIHEKEMEKMKKEIVELNGRLKRWREEGLRPGELQENFGDDAAYRMAGGKSEEGKAGGKEEEGGGRGGASTFRLYKAEQFDFWELYVKEFIRAFELDKAQETQAWSVLSEMKVRGEQYKRDHAREYSEILKQFQNLRTIRRTVTTTNPAKEMKERRQVNQTRLDELNKPLLAMFEELKERLMKIPTELQRRRALEVLGTVKSEDKGKAKVGK